jgi:hypothetical protein
VRKNESRVLPASNELAFSNELASSNQLQTVSDETPKAKDETPGVGKKYVASGVLVIVAIGLLYSYTKSAPVPKPVPVLAPVQTPAPASVPKPVISKYTRKF